MSVPRHLALKELLLPGMAVYASPENLQVYKDITIPEDSIQYSSEIIRKVYTCVNLCQVLCVVSHNVIFSYYIFISQVIPRLSRICFPVILSESLLDPGALAHPGLDAETRPGVQQRHHIAKTKDMGP